VGRKRRLWIHRQKEERRKTGEKKEKGGTAPAENWAKFFSSGEYRKSMGEKAPVEETGLFESKSQDDIRGGK